MKKLNILILLICLFLSGCTQEQTPPNSLETIKNKNKITVGIKVDSKPFGYIENNEFKGFDIDIAKAVARKIINNPNNIEFVPLRASERIMALNTNKVDMVVATLSINERRKDIIDFSIPYYVAGQALMVPKASKLSSIEQLNDKSVAIILGTTGEKTIRLLAPNATVIGATSYKEAFDKLKNNEVDAILSDDSLLYGLIMDNYGFKILPSRYTEEYYAIGIKKGEENSTLKKQINTTIKIMQQNGKLNRIKEKWVPNFKIK